VALSTAWPILLATGAFAGGNGRPSAPAASTTTARGETPARPEPDRMAIGINDLGGQVRVRVARNWAAEARFMTGSASSSEGGIHSMVVGLRGYRFFTEHRRCKFYLGLEGDYAQTSIRGGTSNGGPSGSPNGAAGVTGASGFGNTSGYAAGGFGGLELRPVRRIAVDFDMGPYLIGLKEKVTGASASNWDFVVNGAVNVYLF
jgi:hypothetical protein